jgi:hypothetical protein
LFCYEELSDPAAKRSSEGLINPSRIAIKTESEALRIIKWHSVKKRDGMSLSRVTHKDTAGIQIHGKKIFFKVRAHSRALPICSGNTLIRLPKAAARNLDGLPFETLNAAAPTLASEAELWIVRCPAGLTPSAPPVRPALWGASELQWRATETY